MNRQAVKELKQEMDRAVKSSGRNLEFVTEAAAEIKGDNVLTQKMQAVIEHTNTGTKLYQDVSDYIASRTES